MTPRQMQVVVLHVCWEAIVSLCVNAGVVTAPHQMTTVDYDVGQWSSWPAPPLIGLFDLVLCEWLLLEPLACGEGSSRRLHVCIATLKE